jgi:hypothetical protein
MDWIRLVVVSDKEGQREVLPVLVLDETRGSEWREWRDHPFPAILF